MYIMNPISDTESEPDQNEPIVESVEKPKPKRKQAPKKVKVVDPAPEPVEEPKAPPKSKRQASEKQLEALRQAREKRALERQAAKAKAREPEPEPQPLENQPLENQPLEKVEPKVVGGRNPPVELKVVGGRNPLVEPKRGSKGDAPLPEPEVKPKRKYTKKPKAPEPKRGSKGDTPLVKQQLPKIDFV